MLKFSQNKIIKKFRNIHGQKFDYSKFKYQSIKEKSRIKCIKHKKLFLLSAHDHLRYISGGCKDCYNEKESSRQRMSLEEFIRRSNLRHNYKYDYSVTKQFKNLNSKVKIRCPITTHGPNKDGVNEQFALNHLYHGFGCNDCGFIAGGKKQRSNKEEFIVKATNIHGNKYDYTKVNYVRSSDQVLIICKVKDHPDFKQTPNDHLSGYGCFYCGNIQQADKKRMTIKKFIELSKKHFGDKYDYSKVKAIHTTNDIVTIICPIHKEFQQEITNHCHLGRGCKQCASTKYKKQNLWLDSLDVPNKKEFRERVVIIGGKMIKPDAFNEENHTIYEFWGDYWHGNIKNKRYPPNKINSSNGIKFGDLYKKTLEKRKLILDAGYNLIDMWESEWDNLVNESSKNN